MKTGYQTISWGSTNHNHFKYNKTRPLFLEFNWWKDTYVLAFKKRKKIAWHSHVQTGTLPFLLLQYQIIHWTGTRTNSAVNSAAPRYGQYLAPAHNYITPAAAAIAELVRVLQCINWYSYNYISLRILFLIAVIKCTVYVAFYSWRIQLWNVRLICIKEIN